MPLIVLDSKQSSAEIGNFLFWLSFYIEVSVVCVPGIFFSELDCLWKFLLSPEATGTWFRLILKVGD